MFAEKEIVGEGIIPVSPGRQIILPEYTFAKPGDKLGLFYGIAPKQIPEVKDYLRRMKIVIMRLSEFEKDLNIISSNLLAQRQSGQITLKKYLALKRLFFGMLAISQEEVSKYRKITIEPIPIKNLNITDSVYAIGHGYHLDLYPSKEIYLKVKELSSKL